jgi:hypothetical protein
MRVETRAKSLREAARDGATQLERGVVEAGAAREEQLDRARRRARGVVHTPLALARFAVRAADTALRERHGLAGGLADPRVAIVDPACGPGVFLAAALAVAHGRPTRPRAVWALDVDRAALGLARAHLAGPFAACGWPLALRHVDTLCAPDLLAEIAAGGVVAIVGNPPWQAGPRAAAADHLAPWLARFGREPDGSPLRERKLGVLADTYVRFFAWSLACLGRAGGVFALVSNASYLDGLVHRGMRATMRRALDAIDIVDLGGNAMLAFGEKRDENLCGVRPGIAVTLGARRVGGRVGRGASDPDEPRRATEARVRYAALRGSASTKLAVLARDAAIRPRPLRVRAPEYRFVPTRAVPSEYAAWPSLAEAMPFHREGVQTNRDALAIDVDREALLARLRAFVAGHAASDLGGARRRLRHYDPERARAAVSAALARDPDGTRGVSVVPIAYRRRDDRWLAPIAPFCHRPRPELIAAMRQAPLALLSVRKDRGHAPWAHAAVVRYVPDSSYLSARSSCRTRAFPARDPHGRDNLAPAVARRLSDVAGRAVDATAFIHYALAVLSAPDYRARFDPELHAGYPRVPWPQGAGAFEANVRAGRDLERST